MFIYGESTTVSVETTGTRETLVQIVFSYEELRTMTDILMCARAEIARELAQYRHGATSLQEDSRENLRRIVQREMDILNEFLALSSSFTAV